MTKTFIIAEAGVNHNGDINLAYKLCDAAKYAGVDAIKFQTWKTEKIVTKQASMADYQKENTQKEQSQFDMLKALELSYSEFVEIKKYCDKIGLIFLSTGDTPEDIDFLNTLDIPLIKLGSGDITNIPFLRYIGSCKKPIILSTGMSYLSQVEKAYYTLLESGAPTVAILHCTTNYPCPMNEVNLKAMQTLKEAFKCQVGYSDHTMGIEVPIAAVAMGAEIIEKHFTIDRNLDGPDHKASLEPQELKAMVQAIRNIENALGNGIKQPNQSEKNIAKVVLKTIVAANPISKGEIMSAEMLTVKRVGIGISADNWDLIVNTPAHKDFEIDEPILLY